jgi:Ca-activated chloride channel homolog
VEEMINYFRYAYPAPTGDQPFSVHAEVASAPWSPDHRLVHVGLRAREIDSAAVPGRNLVFLIDV